MDLRTLAELARAPAALTVPGDVLAGALASGRRSKLELAILSASSVCLYWAGMTLNDYADREVDRVERPHRPIPSGRVAPSTALGIATGLTAVGVGLSAVAGGRRALALSLPLAGAVWAYDMGLKHTPAGPLTMALARGLDVLTGAGPRHWRRALPAALTIASHTFNITILSRREVEGSSPTLPAVSLAATGAVATLAGKATLGGAGGRSAHRLASAAMLSSYVGTFGQAQVDALKKPEPAQIQRAVKAGILSIIPLQSAFVAAAGSMKTALSLAAALPLARTLARRMSPT